MWQPIETYEKPTKEWDFNFPYVLFYVPEMGVVMGRGILRDREKEDHIYLRSFDGWIIEPTHWMLLPSKPQD
jgi:hypothetical protein